MLLRDNAIVNTNRFTVSSNFGTLTQTGGEVNVDNNGAAAGNFNRIANGAGPLGVVQHDRRLVQCGRDYRRRAPILLGRHQPGARLHEHHRHRRVNLAADVDFRLCSNQAGSLGIFR